MNFILITGPPGVGKMTVGQALGERLGYTLFHNHLSIELTLALFDYADPEFRAINEGIRKRVFETVAGSRRLPGFIFTLVWDFDDAEDRAYVERVQQLFSDQGWTPFTVELCAPLKVRLARNQSPNRLHHKPSKRDLERSEKSLLQLEEGHRMNSRPGELGGPRYLRIDNRALSPTATAQRIIDRFVLEKR